MNEVDPLIADEGLSEVRQLAAEQFERAALLELGSSNAPAHRMHLVAWHRLPGYMELANPSRCVSPHGI